MDNLQKDYYNKSTYSTYCGGDYRIQVIKNRHNTNGKKILMIRDSFACVVAPFLALQTSELHICDMRSEKDMPGMTTSRLNFKKYVKSIKPDYIIILYNRPGTAADSRFDFFVD